jgi:hypothetical protein
VEGCKAELLPIDDDGDVEVDVDVVPWTAFSERPAAVGLSCVTSGLSNDDEELAGSIWSCKLLGAEASSLFDSIGGCTNVDGTSELDCTAAALEEPVWPETGLVVVGVSGLPVVGSVGVRGVVVS